MSDQSASAPDIDPAQFAQMVAGATDEQLGEGFAANRDLILAEIFNRMPERFDGQKAADVSAVIEWRVLDRPDGGHDRWQVVIRDKTCRVERDGDEQPTVTLQLKPVDFVKLVTGNASGPEMFMSGRLKIEGDLMLAARVQGFFEVPSGAAG